MKAVGFKGFKGYSVKLPHWNALPYQPDCMKSFSLVLNCSKRLGKTDLKLDCITKYLGASQQHL